ncbi:uncharacterized protein C8R40DRAFT_1073803 [Lentinula edodes]|uniref:uncharacterized protein n=1 Tax=Lentinula edodes TaxID=5353 RepID=UPI001E8CE951|nr:uncharacterized protein C8R40DRAFT_1073803 [Lentinula edodes]KAH7869852.1 hypothetical protein C8R40DRAFT_1073803 [Lentinula edodes]
MHFMTVASDVFSLYYIIVTGKVQMCNSTFNAYEGDINYILPNDEEKKLQEWLSAPNSSINYTTALNKRTPGTGVWIFDHLIYNAWREEHGILWIQGKAGSGKTVLLSTIIENLSKNSPSQVFYHYFDGFLLSLVYSMGFQDGRVHSSLNDLHEQSKKAWPKAQPSNLDLEDTLKKMINPLYLSSYRVFLVIFGLLSQAEINLNM